MDFFHILLFMSIPLILFRNKGLSVIFAGMFCMVIIGFVVFNITDIKKTSYLSCNRVNNKCEMTTKSTFSKKVTTFNPENLIGAEIVKHISYRKNSRNGEYYSLNLKTTGEDIVVLGTISNGDREAKRMRAESFINEVNQFVSNPSQVNLNLEIKN